jgi:hypothetical protein
MKRTAIVMAGMGLLLAVCGSGASRPAPSAAPSAAPATAHATPATPTATAVAPGARATRPATAPTGPRPTVSAWWHPSSAGPNNGLEFQWELDHPLSTGNHLDMGNGVLNAAGRLAPRVSLYDIDGILNSASVVADLHRQGSKVVCYIEVGAAGNYYSAADEGQPVTYYDQLKAAGDLGRAVPGYPERYLNIKAASTTSIIEAMIRQQCAGKKFDAVEPDIDDSYTDSTGFPITEARNEAYDRTLGAYAHHLGLAWGQKNGDSDPAFSAALEPTTDFLLTEECNYYQTCGIVAPPYVRAGKLVLDAEYTADWGTGAAADLGHFCPADISGGIDGTLFTPTLAGQRRPCR